MTLLTINTHSLLEADYEKKCEIFADALMRHRPDIIAMQEVNQSIDAPIAIPPANFTCLDTTTSLRQDNHALKIMSMLSQRGLGYSCVWLAAKLGYGKYDEGVAIFSRNCIDESHLLSLTGQNDYHNWKTRKVLLAHVDEAWFCNVHMGWWDDDEDPFRAQWERLGKHLKERINGQIFLMGDFNSPANEKNRGYDLILSSGWHDTYTLASKKDDGYTVSGKIDGWESESNSDKKRIDYIFTNRCINVKSSRIIFDGKNEKQISDHFGVIVKI